MTSAAVPGPRILVLLPVHNRRDTTALFIRCLLAQSYANWHLLLIDDGSTDGTADMVRRDVSRLSVLRGDGNWWWGGALHQGYLWLKQHPEHHGDLVLIINDDTEFAPDFLERAVRAMRPRSLLLAQLYNQAGEFVEAGVRWDWRALNWAATKETTGINCFSTRGLFLSARDFLDIGGFHPVLLPHYLSDYEFTMRAHRKGFSLVSSPDVFLRYNEHLTGIRDHNGQGVFQYLKKTLSIKAASNPVYWTSFILMASPLRHAPRNVAIIWRNFLSPMLPLWFWRIAGRICGRRQVPNP
ncbi:MAG TPA: glycosyltransferase [Rhizomicrobium sp.]|nr:glycosyltransferase [Rhizomicrobium sp.]